MVVSTRDHSQLCSNQLITSLKVLSFKNLIIASPVFMSRTSIFGILYRGYRKIPKVSLWAYIFKWSFLRGLFVEGLIFGGAYLWREICVYKTIGLAL